MKFREGDRVRGVYINQNTDKYDYKYGRITEIRHEDWGTYYVISNWHDVIFAEQNIEYSIVSDSPLFRALE